MAMIDSQADDSEKIAAFKGLEKFTENNLQPTIQKYFDLEAKLGKKGCFITAFHI